MALEHNHNLVAPGLDDRRVLQAEVLWMGTYVDFGAAPNFLAEVAVRGRLTRLPLECLFPWRGKLIGE